MEKAEKTGLRCMEKVKKNKEIEKNIQVRSINCHACWLHARIHMHGWIPRLIRIVGACGLVDLRGDLLLGGRAGASLPSLSIRCGQLIAMHVGCTSVYICMAGFLV
jgi:hypothetical protein